MKIPTCEEMGKEIAEKALDEYLINGKSIREWISILADGEYIKKEDVLSELNKWEWQELYLPIHFKENIIDMLPTYSIPDSAENKGEWIPISERLPENTDDVLATDGCDIFVAWYDQVIWSSSDAHYDKHTPVIAWQPLPKLYEEGGQDE